MARSRNVLAAAFILVASPLAGQPVSARRTIANDVTLRLPLVPCEISQAVLLIARSVGVPAGVEGVPESCPNDTTSIIEALNAVVRAHGALSWSVTYCRPPTRYENATLGLMTFDLGTVGGHAVFLRREDGRTYDPCNDLR